MKIQEQAATVTSNLPQGRRRTNGVSAKGMAHILGVLTNLYNDRELAVIREYYTNALDAHQQAGVKQPVLVTLPTWDKPNYIVQDFGVGMDEDTLFDVYGEYGESTGRDSNDIVGGFGLGSKSAYTIAKAFTVTSVKDGTRTTAHYSKIAHGKYDTQIIDTRSTTEPNGTIVNIPVGVDDLSVFVSKAHKFFAFSKPGSVLVDGKAPEFALDSAEKLDNPKNPDMLVHLKPKAFGESFVIMGNVPYFLSNAEINLSLARLKVRASDNFVRMPKFFTVPIGSVEISPNREGLQMTDITNDVIDQHISFIVNDLQEIAKKDIDKVTTLEEFYKTHARWNDMVSIPKQYKGENVPNEIQLKDDDARIISKTNWGNASHTESNWVPVKVNGKRLVVTGLSGENYKKVNGYLTPYMAAKGISALTFIVTDSKDMLDNKWVQMSENFEFISHEKLIEIGREQRKQERLAAAKLNGTSKRSKIRYPILYVEEAEIRWVDHDEIDSKSPYLQVSDMLQNSDMVHLIKGVYKLQWDRSVEDSVTEYFEMVTDAKEIILLSNTRTVKALEQRVKETTPLIEEIKQAVSKVDVVVTPDLVRHHAVQSSSWHRFLINAGIDKMIGEVKDPAIIEIITPTAKTLEDYKKFATTTGALEYFRYPGMPLIKNIDTSKDTTVRSLDTKYPLVNSLTPWTLKHNGVRHMVKYFNMVHNESKLPIGA